MKFPKLNSHTRKGFFGKVAVLFLVVLCVFTVTFSFKPNEAAAQFVVLDVVQQVKEYVLDNAERLDAVWANIAKQRRTYDFINSAVKVTTWKCREMRTGKVNNVTFKDMQKYKALLSILKIPKKRLET
ncbi:MAG: hypothetical protein U5L75_03190 [Candidatus Campbellbacteria bacterium]|nr:hypothetical protein [Candidatus Campbellbacteria bacterium]